MFFRQCVHRHPPGIKNFNKEKGSLLVEILIALALFAGISLIIGESLSTGFIAESDTHTREIARRIAEEEVARVRSSADISWGTLASLSEGVSYSMDQRGVVASGTATSTTDGLSFGYGFTIKQAPRDISALSGDALLPNASSSASSTVVRDRGSLLVHVTVTAGTMSPIIVDTLLSRWRNVVCGQSDWSASATVSVRDCTSELAGASAKTNIQTGQTLQLCNGCH